MIEKQFYDWQIVGGTDDVMRFAKEKEPDLIWSISRDGDGFLLRVATLEDTLAGEIKAWSEPSRRQSKQAKDFTDIVRRVEAHPELRDKLPAELKTQIERP